MKTKRQRHIHPKKKGEDCEKNQKQEKNKRMENIRKTTKKAEKKEEISAEEQFYFTKLFSQRDGYKKEISCEDTKKRLLETLKKRKMKKQRKNKICKNTHQKGENSVKKEEKKEKPTKNGTYGK